MAWSVSEARMVSMWAVMGEEEVGPSQPYGIILDDGTMGSSQPILFGSSYRRDNTK